MAEKKVPVEKYIEQVVDGNHYKGVLKIAGSELEYEIRFAIPIDRLDDSEPAKNTAEVRRIFQLTVRKNNADVELTDEEYEFFFKILALFAVEFYNSTYVRDSNKGHVGQAIRGVGPLAACGGSITIGIRSNAVYDLPLEVCAMLSAEKFGCDLIA